MTRMMTTLFKKYKIKNTSGADLTNFYIGLFADWHVGADGDLKKNKADYDPTHELGYVWRHRYTLRDNYVGISLLDGNNVNYWAISIMITL